MSLKSIGSWLKTDALGALNPSKTQQQSQTAPAPDSHAQEKSGPRSDTMRNSMESARRKFFNRAAHGGQSFAASVLDIARKQEQSEQTHSRPQSASASQEKPAPHSETSPGSTHSKRGWRGVSEFTLPKASRQRLNRTRDLEAQVAKQYAETLRTTAKGWASHSLLPNMMARLSDKDQRAAEALSNGTFGNSGMDTETMQARLTNLAEQCESTLSKLNHQKTDKMDYADYKRFQETKLLEPLFMGLRDAAQTELARLAK